MQVERWAEEERRNESLNIRVRVEPEVGPHDPGDGTTGPQGGHGRSGVYKEMQQPGGDAAAAAGRLQRALTRLGVSCPAPAGAFYVYPDFAPFAGKLRAKGITNSAELARNLIESWSIATLPGTGFGDAASALRLRLATSGLFGTGKALDDLFGKADALPPADPAGGAPLPLPMLDRAADAFGKFIDSLRG